MPVSFVLVIEEIAAADAAHSTIISVNNSLYCNGILKFGTERQQREFVTPVATGKAVGATALTEPQSGSDAAAHAHPRGPFQGRLALPDQRQEVLDHLGTGGSSTWCCSRSPSRSARRKGITAFLIDTGQHGFRARQDRAEARHPRLGHVRDRVRGLPLPGGESPRRGRPGIRDRDGRARCRTQSASRRRRSASRARPTRRAVQYARERNAFGMPIGSFQMIQAKIADMKCRLEASRCSRCALHGTRAKPRARAAAQYAAKRAIAKLFASESAM